VDPSFILPGKTGLTWTDYVVLPCTGNGMVQKFEKDGAKGTILKNKINDEFNAIRMVVKPGAKAKILRQAQNDFLQDSAPFRFAIPLPH
jgi:hypothetical protein